MGSVDWFDAARIVAAATSTMAVPLIIYGHLPVKDATGKRVWVLAAEEWFLRFSVYGYVLTVAYGLWEAVLVDVPPGPRVLVICLSSAYLMVAAVRVALLRRRRQRAQAPPDLRK